MKPTLLLLFTLLFATSINAQIVNIPDPNFKNALINDGIDINNDGQIQVSEAIAVNGHLNVSNENIIDLTGIEAFVNIGILDCSHNSIASLDLTDNTLLHNIDCSYNQLVSLDITQCTLLQELYCNNNFLTYINFNYNNDLTSLLAQENNLVSIDLSQNANFRYLWCEANQLTYLNIRNGNNTEISFFNSLNNPDLTCVFVDDAVYSDSAIGWYIDPNSTYVETQQECDGLAGIHDFWKQQIKIYPNPIQDKLYVISEFRILNSEVTIKNLLGEEVFRTILSGRYFQFDLSHLASGLYFLNIYDKKIKLFTQKLVKL